MQQKNIVSIEKCLPAHTAAASLCGNLLWGIRNPRGESVQCVNRLITALQYSYTTVLILLCVQYNDHVMREFPYRQRLARMYSSF